MSVPQHRVEALAKYTRPSMKKDLRAFLGVIEFYRRYIEHLSKQIAILTPLTSKVAPSKMSGRRKVSWPFQQFVCIFLSAVPCVFLSHKMSFRWLQMPLD